MQRIEPRQAIPRVHKNDVDAAGRLQGLVHRIMDSAVRLNKRRPVRRRGQRQDGAFLRPFIFEDMLEQRSDLMVDAFGCLLKIAPNVQRCRDDTEKTSEVIPVEERVGRAKSRV